ncbi:MAG: DNA translocase FtsK 4TM domain-containing protein [Oligoflexus sp.]
MASDSRVSPAKKIDSLTSFPRFKSLADWRFQGLQENYQREVLLVLTCTFSLFCMVSLLSFSPIDPSPVSISLPTDRISNQGGLAGAYLAGSLLYYWGILSMILPLPLLSMAVLHVARKPHPFSRGRLLGWLGLFLSAAAIMHRIQGEISYQGLSFPVAGQVGERTFQAIIAVIGITGHDILMTSIAMCGLLMILRRPIFIPLLKTLFRPFIWLGGRCQQLIMSLKARCRMPRLSILKRRPVTDTDDSVQEVGIPIKQREISPSIMVKTQQEEPAVEEVKQPEFTLEPTPTPIFADLDPLQKAKEKIEEKPEPKSKTYQPPSIQIFRSEESNLKLNAAMQKEFEKTAAQLIKILGDFHIEGQIVAIQPGPVVAVYEFQPKAGTKLTKVTGLMEDIALALKVDSIFIHPVSGSRALGIQVPNQHRHTVYLGDILKSDSFQKAKSPLTFAMGQSLSGEPICEDLASMPHLLTAGQTGSGKSVAINALLCSIVLKAKPDEVKMILVDPKILELKVYEGIPHLLMPVITEAQKASLALKWACHEMDRRYQLMELARVRHITGFNQFWQQASSAEKEDIRRQSDREYIDKLPFIVIVIDELADLMLTAPKDVESSIQRLAQKARACGIHLVLATQRPSVDVITGVIKANLPCRSSFKVFSRGDSRTILDCIGAEKLLGKGDMLFLKPGSSRLQRIQGAFLDDNEVVRMMENIQSGSEPDYDEDAIAWIEDEFKRTGSSGDRGGDNFADQMDDPKWDEAIYIAQSQGQISASFLQRSLKIGYNRAARIVETLEQQGLVAAADGSKPRKWLGPNT